jgi:ribose transport system ATP-binding protein
VKALKNINLTIRSNEVLGLIGENGAGKSTLLKVLAGIHRPDEGTTEIGGQVVKIRTPAEAGRYGIGVVHQEQSLLTNLSIAENLLMGARTRADMGQAQGSAGVRFGLYNWRRIRQEATLALERVGVELDVTAKVEWLSFAERQMVEIAKAVRVVDGSGRPPLIVLDEPTSVLEKEDIGLLEEEIRRLRAIGSVVFVSHRLDEVLAFCDRIYVMRDGEIVAERQTDNVDEDELFSLMTGRHTVARAAAVEPVGEPVLQVSQLSSHGKYRDVSFDVRSGEVHALVGVKDSGREELCRGLFGIEPIDSGTVLLAGSRFRPTTVRSAVRRGLGYVPAERKTEGMIPGMTVGENLTLTHPAESRFGPFVRLAARRAIAQRWIARLEVRPPLPGADIARLSGGNQQKIVLAKWVSDPGLRLLILDHPTRGVDAGAREHVYQLIDEACSRGVGVILLADTLEEALKVSHRVTVMRDGEVSATYDLRESVPPLSELVGKMV